MSPLAGCKQVPPSGDGIAVKSFQNKVLWQHACTTNLQSHWAQGCCQLRVSGQVHGKHMLSYQPSLPSLSQPLLAVR
jgi:hypothetical protein